MEKQRLKIYEGGYSTPTPRGVSYNTETKIFTLNEHYKVKILKDGGEYIYGEIHVKTPGYEPKINEIIKECSSIEEAVLKVEKMVKGLYEDYFNFDKTTFEIKQNGDYFYIDKEFKELSKKIDELEHYRPITTKLFLKYFEIENKMKDYFMFQNI